MHSSIHPRTKIGDFDEPIGAEHAVCGLEIL
jgi:hypothetical protein